MQFTEARLLVFSDPAFLVFFLFVFIAYWAMPANLIRKVLLLLASYAFYATWDYRFLSLILISTAVDYVAGAQIHRSERIHWRRFWLGVSLLVNLGILGFFKYFNFFVDSAGRLLTWVGLPASPASLKIILPVGISFYTFQTLSYTIDVYRRQLKPTGNLLDFALFVGFFPQLVAGPIVRAREFLPQLVERKQLSQIAFRSSLMLFTVGLIKKSCISDAISPVVDDVFRFSHEFTAWSITVAVLLYSVQIYCDFSGYSDMAIATARLLGFELGDNFRSPYLAQNISDFWRRWHISLSSWLRDYLYIPLGGNAVGRWRIVRNLLITMFLGGLWHGAGWNFVLWGLLHGLGLGFYHGYLRRQSTQAESKADARLPRICGMAATFAWVTLLWIPFRAGSLEVSWRMLQACCLLQSPGTDSLEWFWAPCFLLLAVLHALATRWPPAKWIENVPPELAAILLGGLLGLAISFAARDVQPFIYFQF